jgi:hypothetical protein
MLDSRTSHLIDVAAKNLLLAVVAYAKHDHAGVLEARQKILAIADQVGRAGFAQMLIGRTAKLVAERSRTIKDYHAAESAVRFDLRRICPELRIGPAHQFEGRA